MDVTESTQDKTEDKSPESRNYKNITTQIISQHQKSDFLEPITLSKTYQTITPNIPNTHKQQKAKINNYHYKYHSP